jgi:S-adenosylmethionine hydrolase
MTQRWISFTTDYGLADGFVAACHGVIARLAPDVRVIDVTHLVPPGDIKRAATVLAQTAPSLPRCVHLAVVDPGVGTERRPIAIETAGGSLLVGPDNGLLIPASETLGGIIRTIHLTNRKWYAPEVSHTFHGRDIFAPVAARLALGAPLADAGQEIPDVVRPMPPHIDQTPHRLVAEVLTVDHFGNVQLAARAETLTGAGALLSVNGRRARKAATFGDVEPGGLVVITDSAGQLAIAVNGGDAAEQLALHPGDRVTITHTGG